jgi:hypothetical protein
VGSGKAAGVAANGRKDTVCCFGRKVTGWLSWRGEQRESERSAGRAPRFVDSEVRGVCPRLVVGGYNEGERYSFVDMIDSPSGIRVRVRDVV